MTPMATLAVAGCLAVNPASDQILAGDLAAFVSGLSVPVPELPVAFAPAPGVQRILRVAELSRMATRFGWHWQPDRDVCLERVVSSPDPARFLAAMRQALPRAEITILDHGRQPLPEGEIVFPAGGLRPAASGGMWMGYVRYAGTHRFSIWARVKVLIDVTRVIAAVELQPGRAIADNDLRVESGLEVPPNLPVLSSSRDVIGKWPRAPIHAGAAIRAEMLESPKVVLRGDAVEVDVFDGAAHIRLDAIAGASGAIGETIPVLNPDSRKRFVARVTGKGKATVGSPATKVTP